MRDLALLLTNKAPNIWFDSCCSNSKRTLQMTDGDSRSRCALHMFHAGEHLLAYVRDAEK
jgi:hypothetical protein